MNVPVAVNCCVKPLAMLGSSGVTAMDISVAGNTVSVVVPEAPSSVAMMVLAPVAIAVASPLALMVAAVVTDEVHVTELVRFAVEPSV